MEKVGNETVSVGHIIKIKLVKSKVSPPGRSCCVPIYFDGRKTDIVDELASIILANGLIPKYDSKGNLSESGRTYIFELEDEKLRITKQSDMAEALRQCPKIQQYFIDLIKSGNYSSTTVVETENNEEDNYNDDSNNDNDNNEAEEIESFADL